MQRYIRMHWVILASALLMVFGSIGEAQQKKVVKRSVASKRASKGNLKDLLDHFQTNAKAYDSLSLRILIKKIAKNPLTFRQWSEIRRYLLFNPQVGYDIIYKWERIRPATPKEGPQESSINQSIDRADQLMISEKFNEAFKMYQGVALFLKGEIRKGRRENLLLYFVTLHSMGRALFGAERYKEALEVYRWIPRNYPRLRQVTFERMWTAFRAGRIDLALGAIASQESSYFSNYLEPESYLIKAYIFKKLCRDNDLKDLQKIITELKTKIEKGDRKFFREWARSDIELLSLSQLIVLKPEADTSSEVSKAEREQELQGIRKILFRKYELDLVRLQRDLTKILAFSNIALGSKDFSFVKHESIDHSKLMEQGNEVWAVNDAEDWVDEIGGHLFIGDSLCVDKTAPKAK